MSKSVRGSKGDTIKARLLEGFAGDLSNVIVRYNNRKLYDYVSSEYITLEDILARVKSKQDFTVVDSEGVDITNSTIALAALEFDLFDDSLTNKLRAHIAA